MDYIKHSIFPTEGKRTEEAGRTSDAQTATASLPEPKALLPEGPTVKGRRDGDNGVDGRQGGQEEDDEQHGHVEVVGARGLEDSFLWDVAAHHSPALEVHGHVEAQEIQGG